MSLFTIGKTPAGQDALIVDGHEVPVSVLAVAAAAIGGLLVLRAKNSGSNALAVGKPPAPVTAASSTDTTGMATDPNQAAISGLTEEVTGLQNQLGQLTAAAAASTPVTPSPTTSAPAPSPPPAPAPTPPPAPAPAPPPAPARTVYIVVHGDTLWAIAQRKLGDGRQWPRILAENQATITAWAAQHGKPGDGSWIYPGEPLVIPS